jgi:hypothetical protein
LTFIRLSAILLFDFEGCNCVASIWKDFDCCNIRR